MPESRALARDPWPQTSYARSVKIAPAFAVGLLASLIARTSLAGLPALSVPCAPTKGGLPVGLQIITRRLDESTMFALAAACEAAHPGRIPAMAAA